MMKMKMSNALKNKYAMVWSDGKRPDLIFIEGFATPEHIAVRTLSFEDRNRRVSSEIFLRDADEILSPPKKHHTRFFTCEHAAMRAFCQHLRIPVNLIVHSGTS
jgi:hypothetical protein